MFPSEFGVTRERIRQIESKALSRLRHPSRSQRLRDYWSSALTSRWRLSLPQPVGDLPREAQRFKRCLSTPGQGADRIRGYATELVRQRSSLVSCEVAGHAVAPAF